MAGFADSVGAWAAETEARLTAVWRGSIDMLAEEMALPRGAGGRLPHLTGNLMNSLLASTAGMPAQGGPDAKYAGSNVGTVTATLGLEQTVWLGFQANYARRQNYGFVGQDALGRTYNQEGSHFVEYAVQMWPVIVGLVAEDVKSRVTSR